MIHEYALEPEAIVEMCKNRENYRILMKEFGIGTPRLMVEIPKINKWKSKFQKALNLLDDNEKGPATELLKKFCLYSDRVVRNGINYDGNCSWFENIEEENRRHKFTAIIANANPNSIENVLVASKFSDRPDDLWDFKRGLIVKRTTETMKKTVAPLVQKGRELLFIDPYFKANELRFRETFLAFLNESVQCPIYGKKQRVEVHVSADYDNCPSKEHFEQMCQEHLPIKIPIGLRITFFRWHQQPGKDDLHNRYILTELGGIKFATGLDKGETGKTDDVDLLTYDQWVIRWHQYNKDSGVYKQESKFDIQGTRT